MLYPSPPGRPLPFAAQDCTPIRTAHALPLHLVADDVVQCNGCAKIQKLGPGLIVNITHRFLKTPCWESVPLHQLRERLAQAPRPKQRIAPGAVPRGPRVPVHQKDGAYQKRQRIFDDVDQVPTHPSDRDRKRSRSPDQDVQWGRKPKER